ncbi:MAG: c-type cytochrome [Gammaproteobacteria bacterium]|nr:c-type cytochrome [Gammaproteobacteria bacterium]
MKRSAQTLVFLFMMISGAATADHPLYTSAVEIAEGGEVAKAMCTRCHGLNGVSTIAEIPHLAGQRPQYLYRELKAYRDRLRDNDLMRREIKRLNDESLRAVAAYYANLDLPGTGSSRANTAGPDSTGDATDPVEAGKVAAAACAGCHGQDGNSTIPGMPRLTGLHTTYLAAATKAYQDASRKDNTMKSMVASLADADIEKIALYYALQQPTRTAVVGDGDPAAGKAAAAACSGCHGDVGNSPKPDTPSLAGQDAQYLAKATKSYVDGNRDNATMKSLVADLSDADIQNLAAFYASQEPIAPAVHKPLTTAQWAQRCDRCHGPDGNSVDPLLPALAGQREDYLAKSLRAYRERTRKDPMMDAMSKALSETDIDNLVAHYAGKKRKTVIFVHVPCK